MRTLFAIVLAAATPAVAAPEGWVVVRDAGFAIAFPRDWTHNERRLPNVRAFYEAPDRSPANCNLIARPNAALAGLKQAELDAQIKVLPDDQWANLTGLGGRDAKLGDAKLVESRDVMLGARPAKRAVIEVALLTPQVTLHSRGAYVLALRPGTLWILTCGGVGKTAQDARASFAHWEKTFNGIADSLRIEP